MVQVDLITGFLGAGKTTFLRRYVRYLVQQGHKVCILENDFGAVNVDALLVQEVLGPGCDVETISGGCDCDTHQRRMRTKLIAMAMRGFDRVVVEPSGIFDVDEFFDILRDDPLDRWYQLGSVIAIVDALLPETLSPQAEYLLGKPAAAATSLLSVSPIFSRSSREQRITEPMASPSQIIVLIACCLYSPASSAVSFTNAFSSSEATRLFRSPMISSNCPLMGLPSKSFLPLPDAATT